MNVKILTVMRLECLLDIASGGRYQKAIKGKKYGSHFKLAGRNLEVI